MLGHENLRFATTLGAIVILSAAGFGNLPTQKNPKSHRAGPRTAKKLHFSRIAPKKIKST